jgi:hypothetical protein
VLCCPSSAVASASQHAWSYPTVYVTSGPVHGSPIPVHGYSLTYASPSPPVRNATRPQSAFLRQYGIKEEQGYRAHARQEAVQNAQQLSWENTQRSFEQTYDPGTMRSWANPIARRRPASAVQAKDYHPLAYAVLRRKLVRAAHQRLRVEEPTVCVGSRPTYTFSSAPATYPYRFLVKGDYVPPEMSQSHATRKDPLPAVPQKYASMKETWRGSQH